MIDQVTEPKVPLPDFVPLLEKILEKTESDRIEWNGDPQNYSYSAVFRAGDRFYSALIEDDGGVPRFAVRDQNGETVFEWNYELENDPGMALAERLFKAAAASYARRTNAKIKQLVKGLDRL